MLEKIKEILESTGLPVVYRAWPERMAPQLPYICYHSPYNNNFAADGIAFYSARHVIVELYTRSIDQVTETLVTDALTAAGIFWTRNEVYIESERCYQITFELEV